MDYKVVVIAVESVLLFILLIMHLRLSLKVYQLSKDDSQVTGSDLFDNVSKSKQLYRDLVIELHPDRYAQDPELNRLAEEFCAKLATKKFSYKALCQIANDADPLFNLSSKFKATHPNILKN